jgi:MoaA/NifB/PqqE/SkfB family radical SAM enzyme
MTTISQRIDKAVRIPPENRTVTPPAPRAVKIDFVRTCNLKCSFCYHSQLAAKTGEMDWPLYTRIIDELAAIGVKEVAPFFFGESFLSPRLPDAIRYAKGKGFENVFLTTNATAATPERVRACMEAGLDSLKFSLNYSSGEQFAAITRSPARLFELAKENIKNAWRVRKVGGFKCGLYASFILYDDLQEARMSETKAELAYFLDEIYALPLYNQAAKVEHNGWKFTGGNQGRALNPVSPVPCWGLFQAGHINFDGTMCGCCFSVDEAFTMGDLKKQSFMEAWHSPKFQALRAAHLAYDVRGTACEGCIHQSR